MTTTLLDRLTAAIDEDERIAREATPGPWTADAWYVTSDTGTPVVEPGGCGEGGVDPRDEQHIARQNPKATLIRCDADRKTVQRHAPVQGPIRTLCATCHHVTPNGYAMRVEWPCPTLLDRAAAYDLTVEED